MGVLSFKRNESSVIVNFDYTFCDYVPFINSIESEDISEMMEIIITDLCIPHPNSVRDKQFTALFLRL
jgi:hypothetical protein